MTNLIHFIIAMLSGVAAQVLQRIFLKLGRFLCQNRFSVMKKLTLVWKGVLWLVSLLEDCVQLLCSRLGSQVRCTRICIPGGGLFSKLAQSVNPFYFREGGQIVLPCHVFAYNNTYKRAEKNLTFPIMLSYLRWFEPQVLLHLSPLVLLWYLHLLAPKVLLD